MCESTLHHVIEMGDDDTVLASDVHGALHRVSLLAYDGVLPVRGMWIVVHCGYAIAPVDDAEAEIALFELHRAGVLDPLTETGESRSERSSAHDTSDQ